MGEMPASDIEKRIDPTSQDSKLSLSLIAMD